MSSKRTKAPLAISGMSGWSPLGRRFAKVVTASIPMGRMCLNLRIRLRIMLDICSSPTHIVGSGTRLFCQKCTPNFAPTLDQFHGAGTLVAGNLNWTDIVKMTTYHVDLRKHLDTFVKVKDAFISAPYPAWSCIGTTELITEGTLVDIRIICQRVGNN